MRLLNTATLQLEGFFDGNVPPYAILSHRWEKEEVTFQDMCEGKASGMIGYSKIRGCCKQAASDGWRYAWVDSCCINKSSSAELSEAINSMFKWYEQTRVCYTYLSDVKPIRKASDLFERDSDFRHSKWFTRGWTLQELLAPDMIIFFDMFWTEIGTKLRLRGLIEEITGIEHLIDFRRASIAQRMSWASTRETTRVEDQAYCLMGIFGVHFPPLYGEGDKAFLRLQLEILQTSNDESLFAWYSDMGAGSGLLADSPWRFRDSSNIVATHMYPRVEPSGMTNKGLRFDALLLPSSRSDPAHTMNEGLVKGLGERFLLPLNCKRASDLFLGRPLGVYVRRIYKDQFKRDTPSYLSSLVEIDSVAFQEAQSKGTERAVIYVTESQKLFKMVQLDHAVMVDFSSALAHGFSDEPSKDLLFGGLPKLGAGAFFPGKIDFTFVNWHISDRWELRLIEKEPTNPFQVQDRIIVDHSNLPEFFGIGVTCFNGCGDPQEYWPSWEERQESRGYGVDKISKPLPSGRSVTVTMSTDTHWGRKRFIVVITIDPKGLLLWPDLNRKTTK
jgi:hypothetical protein